jgi:hypothetical protein
MGVPLEGGKERSERSPEVDTMRKQIRAAMSKSGERPENAQ